MDKLEEIKQRIDAYDVFPHFMTRTEIKIHADGDIRWLLAEVERLRAALEEILAGKELHSKNLGVHADAIILTMVRIASRALGKEE